MTKHITEGLDWREQKARVLAEEDEFEDLKVAVEKLLDEAYPEPPLTIEGRTDELGYIYLEDRGVSVHQRIVEDRPVTQIRVKSAQALKEFKESKEFEGRSGYTRYGYENMLRRFLAPYEYVPTAEIFVLAFIGKKDPKTGRFVFCQNTRRNYWLRFSSFYNFLEQKFGTPNPMRRIPIPDEEKKLPEHLNPEQRALLESVLPRLSERDRVIIKLLLETGLRPGEVADPKGHLLRFCDVFQNHLQVSGKSGQRIVPTTDDLRVKLLSQQNGRSVDSPVFLSDNSDTYLTMSGLRKVVRRGFEVAGIKGVKACPYTLRHSFGADFLDRGGDVATLQKIMGHKNIKTTMIYTHISDRQVVDAFRKTREDYIL